MLKESISSDQIRAARALLRWSAMELASKSSVGVATIKLSDLRLCRVCLGGILRPWMLFDRRSSRVA